MQITRREVLAGGLAVTTLGLPGRGVRHQRPWDI